MIYYNRLTYEDPGFFNYSRIYLLPLINYNSSFFKSYYTTCIKPNLIGVFADDIFRNIGNDELILKVKKDTIIKNLKEIVDVYEDVDFKNIVIKILDIKDLKENFYNSRYSKMFEDVKHRENFKLHFKDVYPALVKSEESPILFRKIIRKEFYEEEGRIPIPHTEEFDLPVLLRKEILNYE